MRRTGISGLGISIPDKVLTNRDLEKMVDTTDEWIRTRTGVVERRIAGDEQTTLDLCIEAGKNALKDAGVDAASLDLIIVATVTPDMLFPATACLLQDKLGAKKAAAFDLEAGCSGFVYGLVTGAQYISSGAYSRVLVVGAEILSRITDWKDRNTCVLFGDGAGACVLEPVEKGGLLGFDLGSDGAGGHFLDLPAGGSRLPASSDTVAQRLHYIRMDGNQVFKFAVKAMGRAALKALEMAKLSSDDIDLFIPHQANKRIIDAAGRKLGLPEEKVFMNLEKYGNTSGASIPLALYEAVGEGRLNQGDIVVLSGFGAGLSWAAAVIEWN